MQAERSALGSVLLGQSRHPTPAGLMKVSPKSAWPEVWRQLSQVIRSASGRVPTGHCVHGEPNGEILPGSHSRHPVRLKLGSVPPSHDSHGLSARPVLYMLSPTTSHAEQVDEVEVTVYVLPGIQLVVLCNTQTSSRV